MNTNADGSDVFHLLANPTHIKNKIISDDEMMKEIDNELLISLKKKYHSVLINDDDIPYILEKIETFLIDISNKNIINEIINSIVSGVVFINE